MTENKQIDAKVFVKIWCDTLSKGGRIDDVAAALNIEVKRVSSFSRRLRTAGVQLPKFPPGRGSGDVLGGADLGALNALCGVKPADKPKGK